jgi:hypothetical protein
LEPQLVSVEDFYDFLDRVPVSNCARNAKNLFDLAKITDRFRVATINPNDEAILNRDDLEQPTATRSPPRAPELRSAL